MRKPLALLFLAILAYVSVFAADTLDVYFIDVGAGDAILIDCGNWEALLDAGRGYSAMNDAVYACLRQCVTDGVLELAILSHPHADHYGGFEAVLDRYEVWEFWRSTDSTPDNEGPTYERFVGSISDEGLMPRQLGRGDRPTTAGLEWIVLGPRTLVTSPGDENDNENSLVLLLTFGAVHFLLVGDIEGRGEAALLDTDLPEGPLVLKVAHHGSETSTSSQFLSWATPDLAVISTDYENPPATSVLTSMGIPYCMTSDAGTIHVSTDGVSIDVDPPVLHNDGATTSSDATAASPFAAATLIITEVEMNPPGSDSGAEWIEIFNPTTQSVALAGWSASYTGYGGGWDSIPSVTIAPSEYYVFVYPKQHLENTRGAVIQLRNPGGKIVDETPVGLRDEENDSRTWQRMANGTDSYSLADWFFAGGTPGIAN